MEMGNPATGNNPTRGGQIIPDLWSGEVVDFMSNKTAFETQLILQRQMNEEREKNATVIVENIVRYAVQNCLSRTVKIAKTYLPDQEAMMVSMKVEQNMVEGME